MAAADVLPAAAPAFQQPHNVALHRSAFAASHGCSSYSPAPPAPQGPIGGMLSAHFGAFAAGERFRRLRERLLAGVKAAQKKVTGKVFSFKQALAAAEGADKARRTLQQRGGGRARCAGSRAS